MNADRVDIVRAAVSKVMQLPAQIIKHSATIAEFAHGIITEDLDG